jgi:hypothetical protein
MSIGMVRGMSHDDGIIVLQMDDAAEMVCSNVGASVGGGIIPGGTIQDGINWFLLHMIGHSEANDGRSTPQCSDFELIWCQTEKQKPPF